MRFIIERSTFGEPYKPLITGEWVEGIVGREWVAGMERGKAESLCDYLNCVSAGNKSFRVKSLEVL